MTKIVLKEGILKIGCDPELMLVDRSGNLRGAPDILSGTKHKPQKVKGGAVLADNVMCEFNTEPAKTSKEFVEGINLVLNETTKLIGKDSKLLVQASANFPEMALEHPDTQEFGCEPDFDAWKLRMNRIEEAAATETFRSAGGHIHVGMTPKSKKLLSDDYGKVRVVKVMDLLLGTVSILLDGDESSKARRGLYGKAGSHRPKSYGVEYRAIGNFWVKSPELVSLMHSLTCYSVQICLNNIDNDLILSVGEEKIQDTINNSDRIQAKEIFIETISNLLPDDILEIIKNLEGKEFDFYKEWNLK